ALLRFDNEVHRIYGVMNLGLHKKRYLAARQYTIADMICYPWATTWQGRNIDLGEFPNVKRWLDEIGERLAVKGQEWQHSDLGAHRRFQGARSREENLRAREREGHLLHR